MNKPLFPEVRVNGSTIAHSAIAAEAQNHKAPAGKPGFAWQSAARALIIRHLLLEDAQLKGLAREPAMLAEDRMEADDEAIIRGYLEENLHLPPVQEEEIIQFAVESGGDIGGDDAVRMSMQRALEQRNWVIAANELVSGLVERAQIEGIEMARPN